MKLKEICENYFRNFSEKNLNTLADLFSENVKLRDWELSASGKASVIDANRRIFSSVSSIQVTPLSMYKEGNTVVAELDICLNNAETLKVVDIIEFDENGKILSIRAYKG